MPSRRLEELLRIVSRTADELRGEMPVRAGILNPFGVAHAGDMLWLADVFATVLAFGGTGMQPGASGFRWRSIRAHDNQRQRGPLITEVTTSHVPAR